MITPISNYTQLAGREIHWMDWGPREGPVVIAWHGLARTSRDMDELAVHFAERGFRVICPDTIGRGLSQWSPAPDEDYQLSFYAPIDVPTQCTRVSFSSSHSAAAMRA